MKGAIHMFKHLPPIKSFKQRGQVLVLYALLIPFLLMFVGVVLDLGWYYLNVSRLQNAADAAALAGAQIIINDEVNFPTVTNEAVLISNRSFDNDRKYTGRTDGEKATLENADDIAEEYAVKNLGSMKDIVLGEAEAAETQSSIIDSWSKSKDDADRVVTPTFTMYDYGTSFYYFVKLEETIEHFFLPGWFSPMDAPVVAVAKLDQTPKMEEIINRNVIVGNWEVQDFYKEQELAYERDANGNYKTINKNKIPIYATDINGDYILDANGNKMQDYTHKYAKSQAYSERFNAEIYSGAWNHFQDFFNTFDSAGYHKPNPSDNMEVAGDFYRREIIIIRDDVDFSSATPYGANSSVAATAASINLKPGHTYNPAQSNKKKTYWKYKDANGNLQDVPDTGTVGLPYKWEYLDSINIDFKPEITLKDKWLSEDWDLPLDNKGVAFNYTHWYRASSTDITTEYVKKLRIHSNINLDAPYKERSDLTTPYKEALREKDAEGNLLPDILWGRIESEPMLSHPDAVNGKAAYMTKTQTALSSVRQIIINVNSSNYNTGYRPVIIFYDGPERYSSESHIRDSKPVILNLGKPFRGVLYAPNSPVVIVGNAKNQFKGFVVAKKYMRLKDKDDFIHGGYRYFSRDGNKRKQYEYTREEQADGTVQYKNLKGKVDKNMDDTKAYKVEYFYAKGDTSGTKYYRTVENETIIDNGVETPTGNELVLYTDEYGEVQFAELTDPETKYGEYDNFGRSDFTTHDYHVNETSADNMLLSGK